MAALTRLSTVLTTFDGQKLHWAFGFFCPGRKNGHLGAAQTAPGGDDKSMAALARKSGWLLAIALSWTASASALAQDSATTDDALDAALWPLTPLHPLATEEAPAEFDEPPISVADDPCDWISDIPHWQEDVRDFFRGVTCHTFRYVDGWFGHEIDYPEDEVAGFVRVGAEYEQYYGFDEKLKLRVRAPLPNASRRFDVLLGRGEDDEFISDTETQNEVFYNPGLVNRATDDDPSWLLGLGGRRQDGDRGWDWSVGMRLRSEPVPYAKLQWYYYKAFTPDTDLRFRQTFFWRNDDGWGTTSRGDVSWAVTPVDVLRWEAYATVNEVFEGAEWRVGQTWYHVNNHGAWSLLAFARGETGWEVPLKEYGLNLVWRQPFTRDWMYLSVGPSLTWPREFAYEKREASWGFGVWLEMEFGQWSWR